MGLYQVSSNNSPGVKFDPTPGVTSFTWDYRGKKTLGVSHNYRENLPSLPVSCHKAYSYQILHVTLSSEPLPREPKNSPGVKFGTALGVTTFTWNYIGKALEISLYLAIRPRLAKFCL